MTHCKTLTLLCMVFNGLRNRQKAEEALSQRGGASLVMTYQIGPGCRGWERPENFMSIWALGQTAAWRRMLIFVKPLLRGTLLLLFPSFSSHWLLTVFIDLPLPGNLGQLIFSLTDPTCFLPGQTERSTSTSQTGNSAPSASFSLPFWVG